MPELLASKALNSLSYRTTHRLTRIWKLVREDGVEYRFSEVPWDLEFAGEVYSPGNGVNASAVERKAGMKTSNLDLVGVLDSAAVTEDDLRAKRYDNSKLTCYVVHWDAPWQAQDSDGVDQPVDKQVFYIERITWTDIGWKAELSDATRLLKQPTGDIITRSCPYVVGSDKCTVDLGPLEETGQVSAIDLNRRSFETNLAGFPDRYFQFGYITWTDGNNSGLTMEVQFSLLTDGKLYLSEQTPWTIEVTDAFTITPGCDGRFEICRYKADGGGLLIFDNRLNFGGHPTTPGNDRMLETP